MCRAAFVSVMMESKNCGLRNDTTTVAGTCDSCELPSYWPTVLTEWSMAAMRTKPTDLLWWSVVYFDMKSRCETPPVNPYLDVPDVIPGPGGLTPNNLKALATTLRFKELESYEKIETLWKVLSLDEAVLLRIMKIGHFKEFIKSIEFIGIAAAHLTGQLRETMILLCDTLSADSSGISLENFVRAYVYLARLNCADTDSLNKYSTDQLEENVQQVELNETTNSQCFSCADSLSRSDSSRDLSCDAATNEETAAGLFDTQSEKGVMAWRKDADGSKLLTKIGSKQSIERLINITVCNDPEFLQSLKQLNENSKYDDVLSLISGSSVISEFNQSVQSYIDTSNGSKLTDEIAVVEDDDEEMQIVDYENLSLKLKFPKDSKESADVRDNGVINNDYDVGEGESSDTVDYENITKSYTDIEINEDDDRKANIKVNTDFIVMLALISDVNNPVPTTVAADEIQNDNESSESEFSLLEKISLNDNTAVETNDKNETDEKFVENYKVDVIAESTDSESNNASNEVQYSEIDQLSVRSIASEKSSVQTDRMSLPDVMTKSNNLVLDADLMKFSSDQLVDDEEPYRFGLVEIDEEAENNDCDKMMCDEGEKYLTKNSITEESVINTTDNWSSIDELYYLPGIGPAIPEDQIQRVIDWVTRCAENQNSFVRGHNLLNFLCPPLDLKHSSANDDQDFTFDE